MQLLLILLRSSWVAGLTSLILGGISGLANLILITLIHRALLPETSSAPMLPYYFAGACLLVLVAQVTAKCKLVRLSQSTAARLQYELCSKIIAAPLSRLESVGSHRLLATLINDVNAITNALSQFPAVCAQTMVVICGLAYLGTMSITLALATLLMAAIGIASYLAGLRWANMYLRGARKGQDSVIKQLRAMIHGIKELKGNNDRCLDFVYEVLLPADSAVRNRMIKGRSIESFAHSWGRMYLFVGIGLLLFVWPRFVNVSPETLTGYTLTILYLTFPLDGILSWLPLLNRACISVSKIDKVGLLIDQSEALPSVTVAPKFSSLEFRGITYSYGNAEDSFCLGPIDLSLSAGEVLFIAGGNGSGKTTLAKILTGLYEPKSGEMIWNRSAIDSDRLPNYRQLFSTVFVEGHLFDRILGVEINPMQLRRWASLLGIEEKVDFETGKLNTEELSRGQHKRLALLVAAMDNRPIFVFDEWAAETGPIV